MIKEYTLITETKEDCRMTRLVREELFKEAYLAGLSKKLLAIGSDFSAKGAPSIKTHAVGAAGGHFAEFLVPNFQYLLNNSGLMISLDCTQSDIYPQLLQKVEGVKTVDQRVDIIYPNKDLKGDCVIGEKCDLIIGQMVFNMFYQKEVKLGLANLSESLNPGGYILLTLDRKPDPALYNLGNVRPDSKEGIAKSDLAHANLKRTITEFCAKTGLHCEIEDVTGTGMTSKEIMEQNGFKQVSKLFYDYSRIKEERTPSEDTRAMVEVEYKSTIVLIKKTSSHS